MVNDKKIEEATRYYCNNRYPASQDAPFIAEGFRHGAKWVINELIKDLSHPSSEEPKNLEYIVFTTKMFGEVYLFTKQVDNTQDWKTIVEIHGIEQWVYRDDIVSLIFKGGDNEKIKGEE